MGCRVVKLAPELLQALFVDGAEIPGQTYRVENGILPDARLVRCWYETSSVSPHGYFCLLFTHEAWPDVPEVDTVLAPLLVVRSVPLI